MTLFSASTSLTGGFFPFGLWRPEGRFDVIGRLLWSSMTGTKNPLMTVRTPLAVGIYSIGIGGRRCQADNFGILDIIPYTEYNYRYVGNRIYQRI